MFAGAGSGEQISVGLIAEDGMTPVFRAVADSAAVFTGSLERSMSVLGRIGSAAAPVLLIGAAFIAAGSAASGVQQNVANLNAALNATPTQLKAIRDAGLQLAQQTQFTDAQIIESQRQLAKAHADTLAIIKETRDVANLAGATQTSPLQSATLLTTAQKTFGLSSNDSKMQSDILATSIDSSVGNANDLAVALKQVGPTARSAGLDLKTFSTAVADLQNQGLRGSTGSSMQTFLQRIMHETPQAKTAVKELGLEFFNLDGTMKAYPDLLDEIRIKTAGLSDETRNSALSAIFGQRGIKIADIAAESGSAGYADTQQHMDSLGTASEINAKKLDTFQGSAAKLGSSINTIGVQFGTVLLPGMKAVGDAGTGLANMLSTMNNNVSVLPQMAVGGAALLGLNRVGNLLDARKEKNAAPGIKAANEQAAIDQANAEARVKAEFTADSQIFAARAELDAKITALDNAAYENWIKLEMDGVKSYEDATAKQLASLQSITEKTLASIAEIDAAQQAQAQANIDRTILQGEKQVEMLALGQKTEAEKSAFMGTVGKGTAPSFIKTKMNAIDTSALDEKNAIELRYANMENDISARAYYARREMALKNGEDQIQAVEREYQGRLAAIRQGIDEGLIAEQDGYAKSIADAEAARAKKEAIARATGANALGTDMGVGGSAVAGTDIYEGAIGNGPVPIPVKGQVIAKEVKAEAGLFGKVGGALASFGAAAGEFVMPVLIALTAKQMIIDPALAAFGKSLAGKTDADKNAQLYSQGITEMVTRGADPAKIKEAGTNAIKILQDAIDAAAKDKADANSGIIGGIFGKVGMNAGVNAGDDKIIADNQAAQQRIRETMASVDPMKKNADAVNYLTTAYGDLESKVSTGTLTMDQATTRGQFLALQQIQLGVSVDKVGEAYQTYTKTLQDNLKAQQDASQQAEITLNDNIAASQKNKALGIDDQTNAIASFGKHLSGTTATKQEIADATKDIAALNKAWTDAGTAINSVDISKGFDALAKNAPALDKAVNMLDQLGQGNDALTAMADLADSFKTVTDAEKDATAAMDGYMLSISHGDTSITKLDQIKKGFLAVVAAAETRQRRGTSNAADDALVNSKDNVVNNINGQIDQINQQASTNWLGIAQNLPAFDKMNKDVSDVIAAAGGGEKVVITAEAQTQKAKDDINAILQGPYDAKVNIDWVVDQQLQDFIQQQVNEYGKSLPSSGSVASAPYQPRDANGNKIPVADQPWGGPSAAPATNPAGWNQFQPLGQSQYQAIVTKGAGGQPSPLDDKYASVIAAAQKYNIDPRYLLTLTQMETNNGTNPQAYTQGNNYGGIKYDGQPGATPGGISPEKDAYANFDSASSFFDAEAANQRTGDYAGYYDRGDLLGARQHYVAGNAPPSDNQQRNIQDTAETYAGYADTYKPEDAGTGRGSTFDTTRINKAIDGGASSDNGMGQKMVESAKKHLGEARDATGKAWDGWCEQFVGDIEQQSGLTPYRAANPEQALADAKNHVAGAGTVIDPSQRRPGDVAIITQENMPKGSTYDPSSIGHTGVVAEDVNKFYDTGKGGIHLDDLPAGTVFIRPDGVVASGPVPGSKAVKGSPSNSGNRQDATQPSSFSSAPITTDISKESAALKDVWANMTPKGVEESIAGINSVTTALDKMNKARYTPDTTQPEKDKDAADAMQKGAAFGAVWATVINSIDNNISDISTTFPQIEATAGPLAANFEKQALAMQDVQRATNAVAEDTAKITALDHEHQQTIKDRAASDLKDTIDHTRQGWIDQQEKVDITAHRRAITEKQQDDDTYRARTETLNKRVLDDARLQQQRNWQDDATDYNNLVQAMQMGAKVQDDADTNHKQSLNDAYLTTTRTFEDQKRYLTFIGSETKKNLQEVQRQADEQHRLTVQGMGVSERSFVNLGKGASTEGAALANASQAAAIDDARKQADRLATEQKDANQRLIDAEDRNHALVMYNLDTESIKAQRKHEDEIRGIDEAATARHQALSNDLFDMQVQQQAITIEHQQIQRQQQDADTAHSRALEDEKFNIAAGRLAQQREWQDEDLQRTADKTARDHRYQEQKWQNDTIRQGEDEAYTLAKNTLEMQKTTDQQRLTDANTELTAVQKIAGYWDTIYQNAGGTADILLGGAPKPPAHAGGGISSQGINRINEQGGELVNLPGGATVIPADQTKRMMDAILNSNVTPISSAANVQQAGDVNISIDGSDVTLSSAAKARIRALVQEEIAAARGQTAQDVSASRGALRRAG